MSARKVLFLCTGNYYRSRFAEEVFNHLALVRSLAWSADSRGLAIERGHNIGPISRHTRRGLRERGIALPEPVRLPIPLTSEDLIQADVIVALDESEHRILIECNFPDAGGRVHYWYIEDIDRRAPKDALIELEQLIVRLVDELEAGRLPA